MTPELVSRFVSIVGDKHALTETDDLSHYTHENRGIYVGVTPLVLKPGSTSEVSEILSLAHETGTEIVPQGGHTGHVAGGVPDESGTQVVVALERMNNVREVDVEGNVVICEAGCVLENIQKLAEEHDRLFPLALGSQGSCQIGGNISTNAGGTGVLAYGNTRQLVLGLEVVLPDGRIWNGLRRLKKDNTGYDLKDLFIGAEGTLGIVTAAVLKLFPRPKGRSVSWIGLDTPEQALELLVTAQSEAGSAVTAFELMEQTPVNFTFRHMEGVRNPLDAVHPWQVLLEISSSRSQEDAQEMAEQILETCLTGELINDAAISGSGAQEQDFWRIRETMPTAQKHEGASMKHDVSVPVHKVPEFLARARACVADLMPGARPCVFGHMGDGNMHYNITQPDGMDGQVFLSHQPEVSGLVNGLVIELSGSVAAEHGVGKMKRELLASTKDPVELELMQRIKAAIDPEGLMNPGKVV